MSNALAIATVTTAFAHIVRRAVQSVVPGSDVLTERPDTTPPAQPRVRLFLYQVTPNGGMRNLDLPARGADGTLSRRPTAALDLHYLLSFYGNENDLEPQRMLGAAVRDLHASPVLMRQMILDAIASEPFLSTSNLADSVEQVKFTPLPLSLEELSKLWSVFFQAPYALSLAYQGTVVLIESEESGQAALPVLRRGPEDEGVETRLGPFPTLDRVHVGHPQDALRRPAPPSYPGLQLGLVLTLGGRHLGGDAVSVRLEHTRLGLSQTVVVPPSSRSSDEIRLLVPDDVSAENAWAPGLYSVSATIASGAAVRVTNQLPVAFAPLVRAIAPPSPVARDGSGHATLTLTCAPLVRPAQRAALLVADREVAAAPHPAETGSLQFVIENAPVVTDAVVRLRVDGIDSLPFRRQATPPPPRLVFDEAQKVTIT